LLDEEISEERSLDAVSSCVSIPVLQPILL
jgi:hypothetical protein